MLIPLETVFKTVGDITGRKPKKRRIEPGQQLSDFRNLNERGLFADRKKFLCAHELRQVEIDDFGLDHHLAGRTPMALRLTFCTSRCEATFAGLTEFAC